MPVNDLLASFLQHVLQMEAGWIWVEWGKLQTPYRHKEDCRHN
jgi:hypothetical protein